MEKNCKLFDYILLFLALLSLFYFIIVVTNSRFINAYILYPIFTALLMCYAVYELHFRKSILSSLPKILNYSIKGIIIISVIVFIIIEGLIIHEVNNKYNKRSDFLIVLGARLYGDKPAPLLRYRLDAAVEYHQKFPDVPIIVSGGQGHGREHHRSKSYERLFNQQRNR